MNDFGPMLYVGDPHGRLSHVVKTANELKASAVLLMGDIQSQRSLDEELKDLRAPVWFIHGNHDTDSQQDFDHLWGSKLADRNIHGRVVELPDGTRVGGLGGVFRESVWYPRPGIEPRFRNRAEHAKSTPRQDRWRNGPPLRHWSSIYPDELDALADLRADVLVSHEAPGYHPNGFDLLTTLAQSMGVAVSVHGHHHDCVDSADDWERQGFRSFGVGLAGITAINANGDARIVVPGLLDARRSHRQTAYEAFKDFKQ